MKTGRANSLPELVGPNLKAVLFDIDGTLCDSDDVHFKAFDEMFREVLACPIHSRTLCFNPLDEM